jgi:hypothetical protein
MPVMNTPSNVPAPPIDTTGAPRRRTRCRLSRSAPSSVREQRDGRYGGQGQPAEPVVRDQVRRQRRGHHGAASGKYTSPRPGLRAPYLPYLAAPNILVASRRDNG